MCTLGAEIQRVAGPRRIIDVVPVYHRILSMRTGERLDRTREGWPILIGLRLTGLALLVLTATWLWDPPLMARLALPLPECVRWIGVGGFAFGCVWLMWMFVSLGRNLTNTVVTRRDAHFVESGPYRYSGILCIWGFCSQVLAWALLWGRG